MCAKLVRGIVAHGNVFFKHRYKYKVRRIDAFTVSSGLGTGDPTVRKVILKKNFGPKNARVSPDFLKMAIFRKKFTKK